MAKVAISIPDEVLRDIERDRLASGESRSAFFRHAVEAFFRQKREREAVQQYVQGYSQHPETEEELQWVEEASKEVLVAYPWRDKAKQ